MRKLFGTDGVRGKANIYPMTPEIALRLGQAIAKFFQHQNNTHRIVIGKDTRRSSYMLELAIATGVCSMGSEAVFLGPISTPGVAFITKSMRADAGIMISASHNQFDDNGIKFFDHDGFKLSDDFELQIEKMVEEGIPDEERPVGAQLGKAFRVDDAIGRYVEFVKRTFPKTHSLDGLKIVVDCANGAAYKIAPMILWELGAEIVPFAVNPNGTNINQDCGALYPQKMAELVRQHGAHLGIALDGDADRVTMADEHGNIIDGDRVIALCAVEWNDAGMLPQNKLVGTIMTNMGVENYLNSHGITLVRTQVGDRYIIEKMRAEDIKMGGEPSGHIIFSRHTTTGDGLIAALQVLAAVVKSGRKLSELVADIPLYPQVQTKIHVKEKKALEDVPQLLDAIRKTESRLNNLGRTVVRFSGTEPVLRLMIEGQDQNKIQAELDELARIATTNLS